MPSSDISAVEAKAHLQKLITESTKVQAVFTANGVDVSVTGKLWLNPAGQYCVSEGGSDPYIAVDPRKFSGCKFCDKASIPDFSPPMTLTNSPEFSCALVFTFKDGSLLALLESAKIN